jgi:hypothetical protein
MALQQSNTKKPPAEKPCNDQGKTATKRTIKQIKDTYCESLKVLTGELSQSEVTYEGYVRAYHRKKCSFIKTEKNYRIVRNLELKVGIELIQSSEEIKKNVASYIKINDDLVKALKDVLTTAKDAKAKFGELRDAASKLDASRKDSCNASQMIILGCKSGEECGDKKDNDQHDNKPEACDNVCEILDDLVEVPETLAKDIDIIFTSAAEILGIQSFSNIKTLDKFQQDFGTAAKAFDDVVAEKMKAGATATTKAQEELTAAIKTLTTSGHALYNKRNEIETDDDTKDFLCHHDCDCIRDCGCDDEGDDKGENDNDRNKKDRFKKCKCEICDICKEVKDIYCEDEHHHHEQSQSR